MEKQKVPMPADNIKPSERVDYHAPKYAAVPGRKKVQMPPDPPDPKVCGTGKPSNVWGFWVLMFLYCCCLVVFWKVIPWSQMKIKPDRMDCSAQSLANQGQPATETVAQGVV